MKPIARALDILQGEKKIALVIYYLPLAQLIIPMMR